MATQAVKDLQQIKKLFGEQAMNATLIKAGAQMGTLGESYLREYPPAPNGRPLDPVYTLNGKPSKFKSVKQRRFVLWAFAHGKLKKYRRTGQYGAAFTFAIVAVTMLSVQVRWGNNKKYGPFVGGEPPTGNPYGYEKGHQSMYHAKTGWKSARLELQNHMPELKAQLGATVKEELLRRLRERG